MAVSFKVPKSPNKDIFDIDTFLGVDLTNSGADMDEVRSPNAENMVRYVPGKVRKRTGYRKDVLFAPNVNVNYASGTSSEEIEYAITESDIGQDIQISQVKKSDLTNANLEMDYKSDAEFYIFVGGFISIPASEEWTHYTASIGTTTLELKNINLRSNYSQVIKIKELAIVENKDENYKWTPAPEYFVERESVDPVYGCHVGKAGTFEGNRVVNVNRALNTHSTEDTFSISDTILTIYTLGETPGVGTKLYVEFDYEMTDGIAKWYAGGTTPDSMTKWLFGGAGFFAHMSATVIATGSDDTFSVVMTNGNNATLKIKNLSVMYDMDDNYEWHPAPEDTGDTFHKEDLYYIGSKNYAFLEAAEETKEPSDHSDFEFVVVNYDEHLLGYEHIEFDITTSTESDVEYIEVGVPSAMERFENNLHSKHIEIYYNVGGSYVSDTIYVTVRCEHDGERKVALKNIKVNEMSPRTSFDKSPINYVYHVGSDFYMRPRNGKSFDKVYTSANKHLSRSFQLNKNLYIIDGNDFYVLDIEKGRVEPIGMENSYIPTLTIAKEPSGGGTAYESLNLLQPGFIELFQGKASVKKYQLSFGNLDETKCKVWLLNENGLWDLKEEDTDFTVNRSTGEVTFTTAPGVSPVTGEDNVKILAYRTVEDYRERITHCTTGALYGIGGAGDRLFLAGNPDHPNWDFYSQQYDPTYFPDTNYAVLGSEQSMITGYAVVNNYLATFKDGYDQSQSVFIREGDLLKKTDDEETTEPVFKLINTLQGEGVAAPYSFAYMQTEPVFLTKQGIYAITEQDITGEKYTQSRSFYLNGKLRKEPNPENAMACIYDDQYILALNNQLYILDGLQATRSDKSEPYATRQYAAFYCTNIPAICIWQDEGIWFGTNDGRVCAFNTDIETLNSYNDDGKPIYACWETPDLDGRLFYKNKTFRYFAVRLMQAIKTSVKMYSRKLGVWNFIREETVIGNPIDFENFDFDMFSFSQDTTEKVIHTKVRVKKVDKARFRVENGEYNEPFGLFDLALEYIESGNYKG